MKQEFITIILAMSPTLESHGAIAAAIGLFKFSPLKAFLFSAIGNAVIIVPLLFIWHYSVDFLMEKIYFLNRFFSWLFAYTKKRHTHHFAMFGETENSPSARADFWKAVALYVFVAIPGPFTGVWAGTVAAYVFGISFWYSAISIFLGSLTVGFIDMLVISGFFSLILQ